MNKLAINKRCSKLKDRCFKMPKISYCHRCASLSTAGKLGIYWLRK